MLALKLAAFSLFICFNSMAAGIPTIQSYTDPRLIPGPARSLVTSEMVNGVYQDDDGNNRSDKIFYVIDYTYSSSFKRSDIDSIINPANGHLPQLFADPVSVIKVTDKTYKLDTSLNLFITSIKINGTMDYSVAKGETASVHNYFSHDYTKFLYQMRIKAEVNDDGSIHIVEVAAVKGSSQEKLNKIPTGNSTFKKRIVNNIKKFSKGTGER